MVFFSDDAVCFPHVNVEPDDPVNDSVHAYVTGVFEFLTTELFSCDGVATVTGDCQAVPDLVVF